MTEDVRDLVNYDPQSGVFRWSITRSSSVIAGRVAGSVHPEGYRIIKINGKNYAAHRLAWFCVNGAWPDEMIDHINGVRGDNRICNLRLANRFQNASNKRSFSGMKGVTFFKEQKKFRAQIMAKGKRMHLGLFATADEAHAAYRKAASELHGDFACFE